MVSPTINVVRYSALMSGIFYGVVHHRTLQNEENKKRAARDAHDQEKLLERAKGAWKAKKENTGVITDPDHPNFDLEKLVASWEQK